MKATVKRTEVSENDDNIADVTFSYVTGESHFGGVKREEWSEFTMTMPLERARTYTLGGAVNIMIEKVKS